MNILVYTPTNSRAVDLQSVMEFFVSIGHDVYLLSQIGHGDLHQNVSEYGVKASSTKLTATTGIRAYYYQFKELNKFVKENDIEVVFAHLQGAGLVANLARKLNKFKLFYIRHNTDEHIIQKSRKASIINWLTNKMSPCIIAPSEKVYRYLVQAEKVSSDKIKRINYGYNFQQYLNTDRTGIAPAIRQEFNCRMLIVSVARLIPAKRHTMMFDVVSDLVKSGMDVKFVCISNGPIKEELQKYIDEKGLCENIFLIGARKNIFDYLEAADVFFHLSVTEASNSAVKEAGYCEKPSIVCEDVGDFSDYISNDFNGYVLNKINPVPAAISVFKDLYNNPDKLKNLGRNIKQTIIQEFEIERVKPKYQELLQSVSTKSNKQQ